MIFRLMFYVLLSFTVIALYFPVSAVKNYGACIAPNGVNANCVILQDCQYMYEVVKNGNISPNDLNFLRRSECGRMGNNILICCADIYLNSVPPINVLPSASMSSSSERTTTPAPLPLPQQVIVNQVQVPVQQSPPALRQSNSSKRLLSNPPHCGVISLSERIVGGHAAGIDEFPWMALIQYESVATKKRSFYCGGSLINHLYVVTAAHCVKESEMPRGLRVVCVRFGEFDLRNSTDCPHDARTEDDCAPAPIDVDVEDIIVHPKFEKSKQPNDIALIRLSHKVAYTEYVKPICLPSLEDLRTASFIDRTVDVAGWGTTNTDVQSNLKMKATVNIRPLDNCRNIYSQLTVDNTQICAGGENGIDSCRGDSGGPLMIEEKVDGMIFIFLAGIVSYGPSPCGLKGWPAIYTRVGAHIDWIESLVRP